MSEPTPITSVKSKQRRALDAWLRASLMDPKRAEAYGVRALAEFEVRKVLGWEDGSPGPGIGFDYGAGIHRVRLLEPQEGAGKYQQREGTGNLVLAPRGHPASDAWHADEIPALFLAEGEKKAHALTALGLPCLGIGGSPNWSVRDKPGGPRKLHPTIELYRAKAGGVVVAYDSDRATNPEVAREEGLLVRALRDAGSKVLVVVVPAPPTTLAGAKWGIDDYLETFETREARFAAVMQLVSEADDEEHSTALACNEKWKLIRNAGAPYVLEHLVSRYSLSGHDRMYTASKKMLVGANGKPAATRLTEWWRVHPLCESYDRVAFHTSRERPCPPGQLNLYVPPSAPERYRAPSVKPLEAFLAAAVPDAGDLRHLLSWDAYAVQRGERPKWCVFCWGTQGTGKTFLGAVLGACYGPYYKAIEFGDLGGDFGKKPYEGVRFLHADEGGPDPKAGIVLANKLKHALTSPTLLVNEKHIPAYPIDNQALVYLSSNYAESLHVERSDRRTFVLKMFDRIPPTVLRDMNVWLRESPSIEAEITPRARWALWEYLDGYKIEDGFDPNDAPRSSNKDNLIDAGLGMIERHVGELRADGTWFAWTAGGDVVSVALLLTQADHNALRDSTSDPEGSVARKLLQAGCERKVVKVDGSTMNLWAVRNLARWRAAPGVEWAAEMKKNALMPPVMGCGVRGT